MASRFRVVAVRDSPATGRTEAVLEDTRHPERGLMWWWGGGGYGWETLQRGLTLEQLLDGDPELRAYNLDLPKDWEEGRLVREGNEVRFVYESG